MKLEQQVCSLELAKRLKELNVKQESYFHYLGSEKEIQEEKGFMFIGGLYPEDYSWAKRVSAFTVAELGEILKEWNLPHFAYDTRKLWHISVNGKNIGHGATEADARAHMLVYLLEHDLITLS